jgi:hypothetical protein
MASVVASSALLHVEYDLLYVCSQALAAQVVEQHALLEREKSYS